MAFRSLQFASFVLDLDRLCLSGPSGIVALRPKSFDVLSYLLHHAGRVVDKEEVIKAVWPGLTVTEESLTHCISEVRRALGHEGRRIIKTVPKRGYLCNVRVSASDIPLRGPAFIGLARHLPPAVESVDEDIAAVEHNVATLCAYLNQSLGRIAQRDPREAAKVFYAVIPPILKTIHRWASPCAAASLAKISKPAQSNGEAFVEENPTRLLARITRRLRIPWRILSHLAPKLWVSSWDVWVDIASGTAGIAA